MSTVDIDPRSWAISTAIVLGYLWRSSVLLNSVLRELIEPSRVNEFFIVLRSSAFSDRGKRLRRRAILFWIVGGIFVLLYLCVILPMDLWK